MDYKKASSELHCYLNLFLFSLPVSMQIGRLLCWGSGQKTQIFHNLRDPYPRPMLWRCKQRPKIDHIPVCSPLSGKRSRMNVVGVVVPAIPDAAQIHDDSCSLPILVDRWRDYV